MVLLVSTQLFAPENAIRKTAPKDSRYRFLYQPLQYWRDFGEEIGLRAQEDTRGWYNGSSNDATGLGVRVVFDGDRLKELLISATLEQGGAGEKRVIDTWCKIQPEVANLLEKLRDEQRAHGQFVGRVYWIGQTEYVYGWSENNKGYVNWVGPPERHKQLARMRHEVVKLVFAWADYVEASQQKITDVAQRDSAALLDAAREEMLSLYSDFGMVEIIKIEELGQSISSPMERSGQGIEYYIWDHWPDDAKAKMMSVAGQCKGICRRAVSELRQGGLSFNPYGEMVIAIHDDGTAAQRAIFGDYVRLYNHDQIAALPEADQRRLIELAALSLAYSREKTR